MSIPFCLKINLFKLEPPSDPVNGTVNPIHHWHLPHTPMTGITINPCKSIKRITEFIKI